MRWSLLRPLAVLAVLAVVAGLSATGGLERGTVEAVPPPPGLRMYLDVVPDSDVCDFADQATGVLVGASHPVQICASGYTPPITAFEARIEYNGLGVPANQINVAPEIADVAPALNDNPDANDAALGGTTDCSVPSAGIFPKGDDPSTPLITDAFIFCLNAMGDAGGASVATGFLLATVNYTATAPGVDNLIWNNTSNIENENCGLSVVIICTNAVIQKLASADLIITKSALPATPIAGSPLTYTIGVTNAGSAAAPNPVVIDDLPDDKVLTQCIINHPGLPPNFDGLNSAPPLCNPIPAALLPPGVANVWQIGGGGALALNPLQSFTVDLVVAVPLASAGKAETNVAAVIDFVIGTVVPTVGVPDPDFIAHLLAQAANPGGPIAALNAAIFTCLTERILNVDQNGDGLICDNAAAVTQTDAAANVNVTKSPSAASVGVGSQVTWTVTLTNAAGGSPASTVTLIDTVDANQSIVSASGTGWVCGTPTGVPGTTPGNSVSCALTGTIPSPGVTTVQVIANVISSPANVTCSNSATATWADPVSDTGTGTVICLPPDVTMNKDKHPETATLENVVNLWICEPAWAGGFIPPNTFGPNVPPLPVVAGCNENGEGRLLVGEVLTNIFDPEGLGAFEFQVKFDHKIFDITVTDTGFLYSTGRIPGIGGCSFSIVNENAILFGCVSKDGPAPGTQLGPTGQGVVAVLEILPEGDMKFRLHPGQENGVVRKILDENCEAADIFGDPLADALGNPLPGIVTGGLIAECGDLDVTVRILEGDLNLDCAVTVLDDQMIAFRYGAFFGSLRYDPWFDLEPALKDFDVDIKDLQKVFGRNGSTCSQSGLPIDGTIPAQPPVAALSNGPL